MSTPPAKFCKVPLSAMPIAIPADANTARNELVSMPKMPTMMMTRITLSEMDTRLCDFPQGFHGVFDDEPSHEIHDDCEQYVFAKLYDITDYVVERNLAEVEIAQF